MTAYHDPMNYGTVFHHILTITPALGTVTNDDGAMDRRFLGQINGMAGSDQYMQGILLYMSQCKIKGDSTEMHYWIRPYFGWNGIFYSRIISWW